MNLPPVQPAPAGPGLVGSAASRWWLAAILVLGAGLRLWRLDRSGWGNAYYSAGVRSMMQSWHNAFFSAFDPAGFVSLDKPPVALWLQVLSARLFGFHQLAVLLPQVIEGSVAVALLYHLVRRTYGPAAGLLAALFLAITPINVAVDRSSNVDACLVMVLLLAAWPLIRAAETGSRRLLLLSALLLGIGFNVKMLAALVVVPAFVLSYFAFAPLGLRRRLVDLTLAALVLAVVSLSWSVAYDLTPPEHRPYAGSSTDNSMLELAIGHNGFQRFVHHPAVTEEIAPAAPASGSTAQPAPGVAFETVPPGPFRLFDPRLASQVGWLLPLAVAGLIAAAWRVRGRQSRMLPCDLLLWSGWAASYGAVYSVLTRFSPYYLATLGPPLCALAGIGAVQLWRIFQADRRRQLYVAGILAATAAWQIYVELGYFARQADNPQDALAAPSGPPLGLPILLAGGLLLAAAGMLTARSGKLQMPSLPRLAAGSFVIGLATLLAHPLAWAFSTTLASGNVARPHAVPIAEAEAAGTRPPPTVAGASGAVRGGIDYGKLVPFLKSKRGGDRFLLATLNARLAAPFIITTGESVVALGGFSGTDPIVTPDGLARMVAEGQVRFALIGGAGNLAFAGAATERRTNLEDWIKAHGAPVDPALWRATRAGGADAAPVARRRQRPAGVSVTPIELYDLAPTK